MALKASYTSSGAPRPGSRWQRSRDAETLKAVDDHFGEPFERPVMIMDHEIGNLDRHIGHAAQDSETLSPTVACGALTPLLRLIDQLFDPTAARACNDETLQG